MARVRTPHGHGTGCALSAAITAGLGLGQPLVQAVRTGQAYLNQALVSGFAVGLGISPPNYLVPWRNILGEKALPPCLDDGENSVRAFGPAARVAELVDALDLGSSGQPWGFDSPLSHQSIEPG